MSADTPTFEEAFERLSDIVARLDAGEGSLTERTQLFEEGVGLSRYCSAQLDSIERKVEILLSNGTSGGEITPFDEDED